MKKRMKKLLGLLLSASMTLGMVVTPVSAAPEQQQVVEQQDAEETSEEQEAVQEEEKQEDAADKVRDEKKTADKKPAKKPGNKKPEGYKFNKKNFKLSNVMMSTLDLEEEEVKIDEKDPAIQAVEEELNDITVLNEEGQSVALTEEQIGQVLGMYSLYLQQWEDNAHLLGVQNPFYLNYNDTKDDLGILGEMLVLAGVSVDDVRSGDYSFDDLMGMIENFYYGDKFGLDYYRNDIITKRDAALKAVKDSGAKTEIQKLLVLNDWLAQNNSFDMSYIMNSGKDEPVMRAEEPKEHPHFKEMYKTFYDLYEGRIGGQFHDQIYAGVVADMRQKFYEGAVKNIVMAGAIQDAYYQGALQQTEGDEAAAKAATEQFMQENAEAIKKDPVGLAKKTFGDDVAAQLEAGADGYVSDNAEKIQADPHAFLAGMVGEETATQIDAQADAFIKDAETNGIEVAPGVTMTVEAIVQDTMKNQKIIDIDGQGTMVTPNDAIKIYTDGAATQLTNGVIGYWEGNHIGVFAEEKSVCMGYSKAFAYLVQYMHPEIYGVNGADTDMSKAANWKTAKDLYYDENGNLDVNQNYNVDLVRITFDAEVSMYGQVQENFGSDHFWNAVKVDGKWYYVDPCYTDVFCEVMNRDRVETDGYMNHMYFMFSHTTAAKLYDGYFKEIAGLYNSVATHTEYEDAWFSRVKSNTCTDGKDFYYVYDSTDLITLLDDFNNSQNNYEQMDVDEAVLKLVRHGITDVDTGDGDKDYNALIEFNYRENEEDETSVARVYNPSTEAMEENELLTKLYTQFEEERTIYPSIAITTAYQGGKLYFNLSNCILSYDLKSGEVALVKEYNTVYGKRDKTNAFGGMAFEIVDSEKSADFTVQNHPIAGISLKGDGKLYVSIATNFAYISGKDAHNSEDNSSYGYEFEESNYNPSYSTFGTGNFSDDMLEQMGYEKEKNDNDEFMWVANFVGAESMSHLAGTSHTYEEVTVDASCGRNAYTENRCKTCGAIEADSRVEVEDSACDHHYIHYDEQYYTKDKNGNWNTSDSYVCTICSYAIGKPTEPKQGGIGGNNEERQEEYKKKKAIYDDAAKKAGHTYEVKEAKWSEDSTTVTISEFECSSACPARKNSLDCLVADKKTNVKLDPAETVEAKITDREGECVEGATVTYTAEGEVQGIKYSVSNKYKQPAGIHSYEGEFKWEKVKDEDGKATGDYTATATLKCAVCGDVREDVEAKVVLNKDKHVDPKCEEKGKDVFEATATVVENGKTIGSATDSKEVAIPATGHKYNKDGICDVCGAEEPAKIIDVSGGTWKKNNTGWWYALPDGGYLKDCKARISGKVYKFNSAGYIVTGWVSEDGDWYYYDASGAMAIGWAKVGEKWYYMDSKGRMVTGKQKIGNATYYLSGSGAMVTGWMKEEDGWHYYDTNGAMVVNGWKNLSGKWYYMGADGVMVTGKQEIRNITYNFTASGVMITGWSKESDGWYYYSSGGAMVKGWNKISNVWYYFDPKTGTMYANQWLNDTYYLKSNGAMATGWLSIDGDYYYFDASGVKVRNKWVGDYYLEADGKMAKDKWIGNYYVDKTGKWVPGKKK